MDKTMRFVDRACAAATGCVLLIAAAFILAGCIATGEETHGELDPETLTAQAQMLPANVLAGNTIELHAAEIAETPAPAGIDAPELEPTQNAYDTAAKIVAKTVYGEAGICPVTERAAVIWCILNRVDSEEAYFPDDIISVTLQTNQFLGYAESNPVLPEIYDLALDVFSRWEREKAGEQNVGRVLPTSYLYFEGDGFHNYFRTEWQGGTVWDWSLPSPYEDS